MKVKFLEVLLFVIWFIVMVFPLNGCLSMITAANTIENTVITGGNTSTFLDLSKLKNK